MRRQRDFLSQGEQLRGGAIEPPLDPPLHSTLSHQFEDPPLEPLRFRTLSQQSDGSEEIIVPDSAALEEKQIASNANGTPAPAPRIWTTTGSESIALATPDPSAVSPAPFFSSPASTDAPKVPLSALQMSTSAEPEPGRISTVAIAATALSAMLLLFTAIIIGIIHARRRRRRMRAGGEHLKTELKTPTDLSAAVTRDTFEIDHTKPVVVGLSAPPPSNAPTDERIDYVHDQLESLGPDAEVLNGLVLCGGRLKGGQAVVQMARGKHNNLEYAIKFFLSRDTFDKENRLYGHGSEALPDSIDPIGLAQFLPVVRNVEGNNNSVLVDACGHPLPPCIVMERGESLDIWAARAQPDRTQAFSMMHQLGLRMKAFHELGYVHCDLKPGNVMWLPRENRWTIIDFGCAGETGNHARPRFSIAYAAPEVIAAHRRRDKTMKITEGLDVWSLGVMAFELLTGERAIKIHKGKEEVMNLIEGIRGRQLPWEGSNFTRYKKRKLGVFRRPVLSLLSRDPAKRPSMARFCEICDGLLDGTGSNMSVAKFAGLRAKFKDGFLVNGEDRRFTR